MEDKNPKHCLVKEIIKGIAKAFLTFIFLPFILGGGLALSLTKEDVWPEIKKGIRYLKLLHKNNELTSEDIFEFLVEMGALSFVALFFYMISLLGFFVTGWLVYGSLGVVVCLFIHLFL